MDDSYPDEASDCYPLCPVCDSEMGREQCWHCQGEGGFHDCGEDCCCCLDPDGDLNETCAECNGEGFYWCCPSAESHAGEEVLDARE